MQEFFPEFHFLLVVILVAWAFRVWWCWRKRCRASITGGSRNPRHGRNTVVGIFVRACDTASSNFVRNGAFAMLFAVRSLALLAGKDAPNVGKDCGRHGGLLLFGVDVSNERCVK